jgi:hypothetical protein
MLQSIPDQAALLQLLERELGVPIGILSEGPTAEEKRLVEIPSKNGQASIV